MKQPEMSLSRTARLPILAISLVAPLVLTACVEPSKRSEISSTLSEVSFEPPPPVEPGRTNTPGGTATTTTPEPRLQPQIYGGRPDAARAPIAATLRAEAT